MIYAEYDVRGRNLDELLEIGHARARQLVGEREYELHMEVNAAVKSQNDETPPWWVAECQVKVQGSS